jgi:hypothetical protein
LLRGHHDNFLRGVLARGIVIGAFCVSRSNTGQWSGDEQK